MQNAAVQNCAPCDINEPFLRWTDTGIIVLVLGCLIFTLVLLSMLTHWYHKRVKVTPDMRGSGFWAKRISPKLQVVATRVQVHVYM